MPADLAHAVIIPTFNSGPRLGSVIAEVLRTGRSVFVVIDGSTDASDAEVARMADTHPRLIVLRHERNAGKGAAVLTGARAARDRGFTHAVVMDADGQHPVECIEEFVRVSVASPEAMILGRPVFPSNVPMERRQGRKLSVGLVWLAILGRGIDDPLFGFRVYPLRPLLETLGARYSGRRYDFDTEAAVRLFWAGVPTINLAAPVRYFSRAEGGISHFRYGRDNVCLAWMHTRLLVELVLWRWAGVRRCRRIHATATAASRPVLDSISS